MAKKIMILGGGEYQLPAIVKAREMGLDVVVCDYYPDCVGKRVPGVIGELISTYDYEGVLKAAEKHKIDAITTLCTDYPVRIVAYVANKLGLPALSEETAYKATDKGQMRKCMEEYGVPIPKYRTVSTEEEFLDKLKDFNGKCVVKAVDNSGSRGVRMLDDPRDERFAAEAFDYCKEFSRSGDILIEEFMEGPEVCVETLNFDGVCYPVQVTDQLAKKPPFFTDAGYSQPSVLGRDIVEQCKKVAVMTNMAVKNYTGSSCTELIVTAEGPKVVEIGPRLAGDYMTSHLVPYSTGVDMVEGIIKIALGETPDITPKFDKGSCVRYYMEPVVGEITEISGLDEAKSVAGVKEVILMKKVGDMAVPLRSSSDRIGLVIAQADSAGEAVRVCEEALNKLRIVTKETLPA